jgi:hypothetical protein
MSASIILVTGPRASGKSTFAEEFHAALAGSILLCVDEPFHAIMAQDRARWNGHEAELYAIVLRHQLSLARDLAGMGNTLVVDGTVLPDQLGPLVNDPPAPLLYVVVLLPPLEECLANEHRATRTVPVREDKVTATWQAMQSWRSSERGDVRILEGGQAERGKALSALLRQMEEKL